MEKAKNDNTKFFKVTNIKIYNMKNLLSILILFSITTTLLAQSKQDSTKIKIDYSLNPQDNPDLIYPTIESVRHQVLYFCFQPTDLGIGIRQDYRFTKNINKGNSNIIDLRLTHWGLYSSLTYGNYKFLGGHLNDHFKLSGGGIYYLPFNFDIFGGYQSFVIGGLTYHHYGEFVNDFNVVNPKVLKPMSFELGAGVNLNRLILGVRIDVLKYEASIDLGYTF
jgi:hypothetical protein